MAKRKKSKACPVVLVRYNPVTGNKVSEKKVCARTVRKAVELAVRAGYRTHSDFHVVANDGRPDSRAFWYGKHFDRLEGQKIVRDGRSGEWGMGGQWNLKDAIREAIKKRKKR